MAIRRRSILASAAMLAAVPVRAGPLRLVLATATPGGGFPVYGAAFAAALREVDPELEIEMRNTRGSVENVPLLEAGAVDLGLVQGEVAAEWLARRGADPDAPKVVTAMYATAGLFAVRADGPLRRIPDLRGRPVALGAAGSGLTVLARAILDAEGLDPGRDVAAITLERAGDGPAMVADGRAAALFGGGVGWPGFRAVAEGEGGVRYLAPSEEAIGRLLAVHPAARRIALPGGSHPGQEAALVSVGSWSLVLCCAGLPEAAGHRLAAALERAREGLAARLPQGRETDPTNTVAVVRPEWLHAGVARRLRETGLLAR